MSEAGGGSRLGPSTAVEGTEGGSRDPLERVLVRVSSGPERGVQQTLEAGTLVVGSHPDADLVLTAPGVSRYHAELALLAEGVRVRDLDSTNGTFVGDSRIESVVLAPGSEVRFGRVRVELLSSGARLPAEPSERERFEGLVGGSAPMRRLYAQLERAAAIEAPVLVYGEAGVGKSEAARCLHQESSRSEGPLVELDLRAGRLIADAVAEAVLEADHGTLVLDHIDQAPASTQEALCVALDAAARRVAGGRVVALARTDLRGLVERGAFRRDLWFLVSASRLRVPPLRERIEDLPDLVRQVVSGLGYPRVRLGQGELGLLRRHDFPGNVRELRRMIEEALLARPAAPVRSRPDAGGQPMTEELVRLPFKEAKEQLVDAFERRYLEALLARHENNVSRAASEAQLDRNHLARLARKHGLR